MRLITRLGIVISVLCLTYSCGSDTNIVPDQQTAIVKYLEGKKLTYNNMNGTYRYIANGERADRDKQPIALNGDVLVCYFEAYTFANSPEALFYANKRLIVQGEDVTPPGWSTDPLELTVGSADVIKGLANGLQYCAKGDSVQLYITSDLAYGNKWNGVVPKNTALFYILNVIDVIKK